MRTRIALATAMAVSFTITSFNISTAATQAASAQAVMPSAGSGSGSGPNATGADHVGPQSAADLSINGLLWPQVIAVTMLAGSAAPHPSPPSSTAAAELDAAAAGATAAPAATPAPAPAPAPAAPTDTSSTDTADWQCIRIHESGDVYNDPTRPSGAYGILESTWQSFGYSGWPYEAAPGVQDALALELYHEYGWSPWSTSSACGLS